MDRRDARAGPAAALSRSPRAGAIARAAALLAACAAAATGCRVAPPPLPEVAPARSSIGAESAGRGSPAVGAAAEATPTLAVGEGDRPGGASTPAAPPASTAARSPDADGFDPNETIVTLEPFVAGLAEPLYGIHDGIDAARLYVVEKAGRVRIVDVEARALVDEPFLDLSDEVNSAASERGLLSIAFHPDYARNGRLFVDYTRRDGAVVVAELAADAARAFADPAGERRLLVVDHPAGNHNGGQLAFGPDGALYVGLGDGGGSGNSGNAQAEDTLLGKVLRLDVDGVGDLGGGGYRVPADNPFIDGPFRPEVWAYGLRNPWRFAFDRLTGALYIGDVGDSAWEEIDVQPAASRGGANYGWPELEGDHCHGGDGCDPDGRTVRPAAEYAHEDGNCAVSGGFVYRGAREPSLWGVYLYGDYCSGRVWGLWRRAGAWRDAVLTDTDHAISGFGEDMAGEVYALDLAGGAVLRVTTGGS